MKVSAAVLETLTGFADALNITPVLEKDTSFLETLCSLLGNSSLQLTAAECLLVLLSKRVGQAFSKFMSFQLKHCDASTFSFFTFTCRYVKGYSNMFQQTCFGLK